MPHTQCPGGLDGGQELLIRRYIRQTLSTYAQQGLWYFQCRLSVCLSVCHLLFWHYRLGGGLSGIKWLQEMKNDVVWLVFPTTILRLRTVLHGRTHQLIVHTHLHILLHVHKPPARTAAVLPHPNACTCMQRFLCQRFALSFHNPGVRPHKSVLAT